MINWWEIGKGTLILIGAYIYFKYVNFSEEKASEKKFGDDYGDMYRLADKMRDFGGWIGGILIVFFGILYIYNEMARNYGWALFMAKE
ncbi:hypothetical protein [Sinomicrobium sp. M5D2P17]